MIKFINLFFLSEKVHKNIFSVRMTKKKFELYHKIIKYDETLMVIPAENSNFVLEQFTQTTH